MRLMQVMAGAHQGGAESFFTRLAPALEKTKIRQEFIKITLEGGTQTIFLDGNPNAGRTDERASTVQRRAQKADK